MDVERFLTVLREDAVDASSVSLALVGYGMTGTDLRNRMTALGLPIGHVTTDLHIAAKWRNEPQKHAKIVALATGRYPGVSTLAHFPRGRTGVFARDLLRWARRPETGLASTLPQRALLEALAENANLSPLVSLIGVADFLTTWEQGRFDDELGAPRHALPHLGLLPDRNVLGAPNAIAERLLKNFTLAQEIARMTGGRLEDVRRKVRRAGPDDQERGLDVLACVEVIRKVGDFESYSALEYEDARAVFKEPVLPDEPSDRPSESPPPQAPSSQRTDSPTGEPPETQDGPGLTAEGGGLLIDGEDLALEGLVGRLQSAMAEAIDGDEDLATGHYDVGDDEREFEFEIERELLTWIPDFCSVDAWGGFFEATTGSFEEAIDSYAQCEPTLLRPLEPSIPHDGEQYDLRLLLSAMQEALSEEDVTPVDFCALWDKIVTARATVLSHLPILVHQPMLALAGDAGLRDAVAELLAAWEQFYGKLAQHHESMHEIDHAWTQLVFEVVASLDVVQIKTRVDAGRATWKAVLLPTHPLHLWRYERIGALARGLKLGGMDRSAVLEQLKNPEHYLGVIYLTTVPDGKGGNQALPVARDYHGLAVFENLRNAYSGSDGVDVLEHCVRQFEQIYVNHARPLRLALINPPNASRTLVTLLHRGRGRPLARAPIVVDVYATPDHEDRLRGARRFAVEDRDQIEEHIAAGRLQLRVSDDVVPLDERLEALKERPVHIVATFDEATTAMRHQPRGINVLPMSPFAVRRRIAFQGIQRKVELLPSLEESVFRSFYDMVGELRGTHTSQTPQASADAERVAKHIEDSLVGARPAALWFFFADRALPSPGRVGAARILERLDGRRRCVCYDASYQRLALLLRPPLDEFNLRYSHSELEELLKEGVALMGDGLVDLFRADAQADTARVRGFAGMLVAARDYRARHPGALLVSVDTKLARLWLRLSDATERCDLMALRRGEGVITVDAIEVKTAGRESGITGTEIQKATGQLTSTLEAVGSGLSEGEHASVLAAPRQEMLKEVFVSGCQSLMASKDDRTRWVRWLEVLFGQAESGDEIRLGGTVYTVELRNNNPSVEQRLKDKPYRMRLRRVREERIQELLSPRPSSPPRKDDDGGKPPKATGNTLAASNHVREIPEVPVNLGERDPDTDGRQATRMGADAGVRFVVGTSVSAGERKPYCLHPSNTRLNQLNIGVVGDLGTGKTQLTKALIYEFTHRAASNRGHTPKFLIFDYKRDYTKTDFVDAVGARVVTPHRIPLNVFDLPARRDHLPAARLGRVKFLNDVLHKIYGGIGPRQRNQVKTAVLQGYNSQPANAPTLKDVLLQYAGIVGDRIDAPYSILSDLVDLEIFVERAEDAESFDDFFTGVTVIDLASLGIGSRERNMVLVLFLNLYYEYMINLKKRPYLGTGPQCRFIDSMLLVDEADNIMKYNFDVLRQILLQGREFGVGVILASQFLSHFRTREMDYSEPLLTWFIHKVPNVTAKELQSIGLNKVMSTTVERVKSLDVHQCLYKTLDVPGRFMKGRPFYEIAG